MTATTAEAPTIQSKAVTIDQLNELHDLATRMLELVAELKQSPDLSPEARQKVAEVEGTARSSARAFNAGSEGIRHDQVPDPVQLDEQVAAARKGEDDALALVRQLTTRTNAGFTALGVMVDDGGNVTFADGGIVDRVRSLEEKQSTGGNSGPSFFDRLFGGNTDPKPDTSDKAAPPRRRLL